MIKPICYKCKKELNKFGALLYIPTKKKDLFKKIHICIECYKKWLN